MFNMNVPTRVGFQTPFTNITMDVEPPRHMCDEGVVIKGRIREDTYGDHGEEMDMINRAFSDVLLNGDAKGRPFTFPIPTYNITDDFDWDNEALTGIWEATAKYGSPYFSNYVRSDMDPADARSMCCRLRLDKRELKKRGGGLFGADPKTGSIGVVTINLPRLGYLSKDEDEFMLRLERMMELSKNSLELKRQVVEELTQSGLHPYSKYYLSDIKESFGEYWKNHFSTIGIIGMNDTLLNLMDRDISRKKGIDFAVDVLEFMRERLREYQAETGNLFNLEATPAEGTSYRLARADVKRYPRIRIHNVESYDGAEPYYTNSTQLPVGYTDDLFEALELQEPLQTRYTGGTVFHGFIGERLPSVEATKNLVRRITEASSIPYFTLTPTFSICSDHGYISGEHEFCPKWEGVGNRCEVYSRVVGYLRPVDQWNAGKREEFFERKTFKAVA